MNDIELIDYNEDCDNSFDNFNQEYIEEFEERLKSNQGVSIGKLTPTNKKDTNEYQDCNEGKLVFTFLLSNTEI